MKYAKIALQIFIVGWIVWTYTGRSPERKEPYAAIRIIERVGNDSVCGRNVVGIQPYMIPEDYLSYESFFAKMDAYFAEAKKAGYFRSNTVVLLPEYVGTWLIIAGEKESVAQAETVTGAMTLMVLSNPLKTLRFIFYHREEQDRMAAALFRMKAQAMASIYAATFTQLSKAYGVTINAGSIVLPGAVGNGAQIVVSEKEPLYNTSFIFHPFGIVDGQVIRKSFPISSELPFVTPAPIDELNLFELPIGKTALLVCADSWYPESYARVKELGAEVILVNSYCAGDDAMDKLWRGYDGGSLPPDVDQAHIGTLTEYDAWVSYALPGRLSSSGATVGANIFLRGQLWDLGTDGQPFFVKNGQLVPVTPTEEGGIWNFCF